MIGHHHERQDPHSAETFAEPHEMHEVLLLFLPKDKVAIHHSRDAVINRGLPPQRCQRSTHPSPPTPTADPPVAKAPNTEPVARPNLKNHPPLIKDLSLERGQGAEKPGKEAFPGAR